jgi:hypothetical protein
VTIDEDNIAEVANDNTYILMSFDISLEQQVLALNANSLAFLIILSQASTLHDDTESS